MELLLNLWVALFSLTLYDACYAADLELGVTNLFLNVDGNNAGAERCFATTPCDPTYRYRSINGTCNNLANSNWGETNTPFLRMVPGQYSDGNHSLRLSSNGQPLPNLRKISVALFPDVYVEDKLNTLAVMQWGQLLTHDGMRATSVRFNDCCDNNQMPAVPPPGCIPQEIPADDEFYSQYHVTCQSYGRSMTTDQLGCPITPQQPLTGVSQYLDMSVTYASDNPWAAHLREYSGGRLASNVSGGEEWLISVNERIPACDINSTNEVCFISGDVRVNQNPQVASLSVMLLREHNRLAAALSTLNPQWDDETLFQEARRINIAQYQHISYSQYLPTVLALEYINGFSLTPLESGYTNYNSSLNGGTLNEFATAAWRSFHNTVQGFIKVMDESRCPFKELRLSDWYWISANPTLADYNSLLRGMISQPERAYTNYFTDEVTNFFNRSGRPFGEDLEITDMIRGRDHGLAPYNVYRQICGLSTFSSFADLHNHMPANLVYRLSLLYDDVNDIDVFVGGTLEYSVPGGMGGPLFQCIIAQQFARWKYGDRFYYEHGNQAGSFSPAQLNAIRRVTLSSVLCQNTNIQQIQQNVFLIPSESNSLVPCSDIPQLDLSAWQPS